MLNKWHAISEYDRHTLTCTLFAWVISVLYAERVRTDYAWWLLTEAKASANILSVFTLKGFTSRSVTLPVTFVINFQQWQNNKKTFFFSVWEDANLNVHYILCMIKKEPLISRVHKEQGILPSSKRRQIDNSWPQYFESKIQLLSAKVFN